MSSIILLFSKKRSENSEDRVSYLQRQGWDRPFWRSHCPEEERKYWRPSYALGPSYRASLVLGADRGGLAGDPADLAELLLGRFVRAARAAGAAGRVDLAAAGSARAIQFREALLAVASRVLHDFLLLKVV